MAEADPELGPTEADTEVQADTLPQRLLPTDASVERESGAPTKLRPWVHGAGAGLGMWRTSGKQRILLVTVVVVVLAYRLFLLEHTVEKAFENKALPELCTATNIAHAIFTPLTYICGAIPSLFLSRRAFSTLSNGHTSPRAPFVRVIRVVVVIFAIDICIYCPGGWVKFPLKPILPDFNSIFWSMPVAIPLHLLDHISNISFHWLLVAMLAWWSEEVKSAVERVEAVAKRDDATATQVIRSYYAELATHQKTMCVLKRCWFLDLLVGWYVCHITGMVAQELLLISYDDLYQQTCGTHHIIYICHAASTRFRWRGK